MMQKLCDCYTSLLEQASSDESGTFILLERLWPVVVGHEIARYSRPTNLINGDLTIVVTDPAWRKELKLMTQILVQSINRFWGVKLIDRVSIDQGY